MWIQCCVRYWASADAVLRKVCPLHGFLPGIKDGSDLQPEMEMELVSFVKNAGWGQHSEACHGGGQLVLGRGHQPALLVELPGRSRG